MSLAYQNLSAWLVYLESLSHQRRQSSVVVERAKRFEDFKKIAISLNLLDWHCPVITIAGTNGKGSCVALLTSILKSAGYRVGAFTSPHLLRYNERIQIDAEPVHDNQLCGVFEIIYKMQKASSLGYFEYSTLAALLLFQAANLDIIILEVGIGGRFDAVNSVNCDIAIISSIDFDHTHILGNSIEAIAFEKAGIMRSKRPAIWGDHKLPINVKQYAQALDADLLVQGKEFGVLSDKTNPNKWQWWGLQSYLKDLPLPHMIYLPNAACVLQAITYLKTKHHIHITKQAIDLGLQNVALPGRFQILANDQTQIILDVAHNPASVRLLAKHLAGLSYTGRLFAVLGVLANKDIHQMLLPLIGQITHWYLGTLTGTGGTTAQHLALFLQTHSFVNYTICATVEKAYTSAKQALKAGDVIIVFGSFRTIEIVTKLET